MEKQEKKEGAGRKEPEQVTSKLVTEGNVGMSKIFYSDLKFTAK